MSYLFTSRSVSEGHPDKVCDRVSDTVLDLFLQAEPEARVACETFATTDRVIIGGEVRASANNLPFILANVERAVRDAIKDIGYEQEKFHHAHLKFQSFLHEQSADIALGVDGGSNKDEGCGRPRSDVWLCLPRDGCFNARGYLLLASDPAETCGSA